MRPHAIATLFVLIAPLCASVTNVTPKSERNDLPKGTRHFSEDSKPIALTALAELLRDGRGIIEFVDPVTYVAEEVDEKKVADDGSRHVTVERARRSFPFERGRYRAPEDTVDRSATRIFTSGEGLLVIQRGRDVRLIPVAGIKVIKARVQDRAAEAEGDGPQEGDAKQSDSE